VQDEHVGRLGDDELLLHVLVAAAALAVLYEHNNNISNTTRQRKGKTSVDVPQDFCPATISKAEY
jgi:hypothetical protein